MIAAIYGGRLADRLGCRWVMIAPRALLMLVVYPAFLLLVHAKSEWALIGVTAVVSMLTSLSAAASFSALTEAFPNEVRSSGLAIAYAIAVSVFGGTTQFVIAWLIGVTADPLSPAYYVIASSILGLWAMVKLPQNDAPGSLD